MTWRRRAVVVGVYIGLIISGWLVGQWLMEWIAFDVRPSNESQMHKMVMSATAIYILASAIPFVPGAEIGFVLILGLGTPIVVLVYASMVAALTLSYMLGRFVPAHLIAALFDFLGLKRARQLILHMAPLGAAERLELLTAHAPRRIVPFLLRHRFLAFAVVLNLPGNTLLGGGGGLALVAGMSGLFSLPAFLATTGLAVAPLPLVVWLTGYVP